MEEKKNQFDNVVFGNRFRMARNRRGLTQNEMANALGTHQTVISLYESGEREPSPKLIGDYAHICKVTPDYFYQTMYDLTTPEEKFICQVEQSNDSRALRRFEIIRECLEAILKIIQKKITELSGEASVTENGNEP